MIDRKTRLEDRFISAFEINAGHTLNGSNAVLQGLRREAIERFAALGFPTRKNEAWKYTNITSVLEHDYRLQLAPAGPDVTAAQIAPLLIPDLDAHLVVLVNGRFSPSLSQIGALQAGVIVTGFAEASAKHGTLLNEYFSRFAAFEEEPFTALNTAFTQDGVFVYVPEKMVLDRPIHVLSVLSTEEDLLIQPRNLFVFEQGSEGRIIERGESLTHTRTFTNGVDEIFVGRHANVDHYKVQNEGSGASQIGTTQVYQEDESVFSIKTFTLGGDVVRNNLTILPDGEHCETHLIGLYLPRGSEHVDNHTLVDHARPNCFSNELYKGVVDDRASAVFNGKVFVRQDAQKTNAFQENKTILLTADAKMNTKPELEIYADDVKCSHGATTGQIDRDAVFYLRSRGLNEKQARALLLLAFARDVVENIRVDALRTHVDSLIAARFGS